MSTLSSATFLFFGSLNDFLTPAKKGRQFTITFSGSPGIKDIIESAGIPHPEIHHILVNSSEVNYSYRLENEDRVEVFPFPTGLVPDHNNLSFVLDVHLGKLARFLRVLGFDSLYRNDFSDRELVTLSCKEKRILLTRDIGVLKYSCVTYGYWVRSTVPLKQAQEVAERFQLCSAANPLTLCVQCSGKLERIEKNRIQDKLEPRTLKYYNDFTQCINCGRIYWQGSHAQNMNALIKKICPQLN